MTTKEIVRALRCTSTPGDHTSNCEQCPYWKKEQLNGRLKEKLGTDTWTSCDVDQACLDAADLIEHLTADVEDLRKELEWKDMVIALAQRKQAEAEAERDALREKQRWIPVTERFPEKQAWYHVAIRDKKTMRIAVEQDLYAVETAKNFGHEIGFCKAKRWPEREELIAWMPFPEAPEEGEKA